MQQKPDAVTALLFIFLISFAVSGFTTMMHDDAEIAATTRNVAITAAQMPASARIERQSDDSPNHRQ